MGKIIAIANQKGGVGKTTTAINLSAALAEKGKKTLLIDLDSQGNATSGVGIEKNEAENTSYELIMGNADLEDCLKKEVFPLLDVIPANSNLTAAEIELLDAENRESRLKDITDSLKDSYDFIIIDCPPSLNMLTINALISADSVLIPIQCEYYALEGLSQLLQTIEVVKERTNENLKIEGIVFTMYDPRVRLSGQVVQNVRHNLGERTFKTLIPRNVRLAEAPSHGKPVMHYARICSGTRAYRNLSKEIIAIYELERIEKINTAIKGSDEVKEEVKENEEMKTSDQEFSENESLKEEAKDSEDVNASKQEASENESSKEEAKESEDANTSEQEAFDKEDIIEEVKETEEAKGSEQDVLSEEDKDIKESKQEADEVKNIETTETDRDETEDAGNKGDDTEISENEAPRE